MLKIYFWITVVALALLPVVVKATIALIRRERYTLSKLDGGVFAGRSLHPTVPLLIALALAGGALALLNRVRPLFPLGEGPCRRLLPDAWATELLNQPVQAHDIDVRGGDHSCTASLRDPLKRSGSGNILKIEIWKPENERSRDFYFSMAQSDLQSGGLQRTGEAPMGIRAVTFGTFGNKPSGTDQAAALEQCRRQQAEHLQARKVALEKASAALNAAGPQAGPELVDGLAESVAAAGQVDCARFEEPGNGYVFRTDDKVVSVHFWVGPPPERAKRYENFLIERSKDL